MYVDGNGSQSQRTLAHAVVQSEPSKVKASALQLWTLAGGMGGLPPEPAPPVPPAPHVPALPQGPASPASGPPDEPLVPQAGVRTTQAASRIPIRDRMLVVALTPAHTARCTESLLRGSKPSVAIAAVRCAAVGRPPLPEAFARQAAAV